MSLISIIITVLVFCCSGICAAEDIRRRIIPNVTVASGFAVLSGGWLAGVLCGEAVNAAAGLTAAGLWCGLTLPVAFLGGLGMGDLKLGALLFAHLGQLSPRPGVGVIAGWVSLAVLTLGACAWRCRPNLRHTSGRPLGHKQRENDDARESDGRGMAWGPSLALAWVIGVAAGSG